MVCVSVYQPTDEGGCAYDTEIIFILIIYRCFLICINIKYI